MNLSQKPLGIIETRTIAAFALAMSLSGCSTPHISDLSSVAPKQTGDFQERSGLGISVIPLTDRFDIRNKFGSDLIEKGILPVFIKFNNESASESFLADPEKCHLAAGLSTSDVSGTKPETLTVGSSVQIAGSALVSGPLIIAGAIIATDALSANHQFAVNQLRVHTLSPGTETAGYLYFKIPTNKALLANCSIVVEVPTISSSRVIAFPFPLHITTP